jgi:hypothetical protein
MEFLELRPSTVRSKRLAGTCAIALGMAIGSSMPVAYSFVFPLLRPFRCPAVISLKSKDPAFVHAMTCHDIQTQPAISSGLAGLKSGEDGKYIRKRGMTRKQRRVLVTKTSKETPRGIYTLQGGNGTQFLSHNLPNAREAHR